MAKRAAPAPFDGLIVVDKPAGWTSHDVVGRLRRLVGTRRVGHAGTLDPMATGVLVCGVGRATKLLGHVSDTDKAYATTIRLGVSTTTDDAEGEVISACDASTLLDGDQVRLRDAVADLSGDISQRPSAVSAIKVDGVRAYKRVRDGEDVVLASRPVHIASFDVAAVRPVIIEASSGAVTVVDVDATVTCSTGTYIRALARDLGEALGVGGHLTMLRRTRVGRFDIEQAHTLAALESELSWLELDDVCRMLFPVLMLTASEAADFRNGRRIDWPSDSDPSQVVGVFDDAGSLLGLAEPRAGKVASLVVWRPATDGELDSGKI